jgi:acyl-CoA dehydrogenase
MSARDPLELAREASAVAAAHAAATDRSAAFPEAGIQALRDNGLMGLLAPKENGGFDASHAVAVEVAQILSASCLSTAMLWAMHCQQVAVVADYASEPLRGDLLNRVAAGKMLIASVTTEPAKGGHLLSAQAALVAADGGGHSFERESPVVTGGLQSDGFLLTMRRNPEATPNDIVLVYADKAELALKKIGGWDTLGMRGTSSLALDISGRVPGGRLIDPEGGFDRVAATTMVPSGHLMWSACWLGAAKGAYRQLMHIFRTPELRQGYPLKSDLFAERIARIRLEIDMVEAFLTRVTSEFDALRLAHGTDLEAFKDYGFDLRVNEVKIATSEHVFRVVDAIMQLAGLRHGYRVRPDNALERVFRDLRSASLMFSNDRLLVSNGKLALLGAGL